MRTRRGNVILETALIVPVIVLLLVGMVQIARVTYTYYTLRKTIYSIATYISTQQGVNFCDAGDPAIVAAKSFGLTGSIDNSQPAFVTGLTADMIQITPIRYDAAAQTPKVCSCSVDGCDAASGGGAPDFIVVSIPDGYPVTPRIPMLPVNTIPLRPHVKVPYGGT